VADRLDLATADQVAAVTTTAATASAAAATASTAAAAAVSGLAAKVNVTDAAELAADGTVVVMGVQGAGPALGFPTTGVVTLPNADPVTGNITVYTQDGTPVTFVMVAGTVGGGGTVGDPPGAPTGLGGTAGSGQVALTWTAPADPGDSAITTYVVQYRLTGGSTWSTFAHGASTTAAITVTGLSGGNSYDFRVAATNSDGTGAWSSVATATPNVAGLMFADYFDRTDGAVGNGWTVHDSGAAPAIVSGVLVGGGSGGQSIVHRADVSGARNAVFTWHVPANVQFNGIVRYATDLGGTFEQFIRVADSTVLQIVDYPSNALAGELATPSVAVPTHDYDVVLVCDGADVSLFIDGIAGPAISSAPWGSSSTHDGFGFDLRGSTRKIDSIVVTELDA
jgi:hypothetical protein